MWLWEVNASSVSVQIMKGLAMMKYGYAIGILGILAATPALADPHLRGGLWENKTTMEMDMGAMGKQPPHVIDSKFCLTQEDADQQMKGKLPPEMKASGCAEPVASVSGNVATMDITCKDTKMHVVTTLSGDSAFSADMTGISTIPQVGKVSTHNVTTGKRLGDCPPGAK
jgi:hypothetical protein